MSTKPSPAQNEVAETEQATPTPAPVEVEATSAAEKAKRTHTTPIGKLTLLSLAKTDCIHRDENGYYIEVASYPGGFVKVHLENLIGLNDSITLAIARVLDPKSADLIQAQSQMRKALAAGYSAEELIAGL